jgi:aminomethyltransferase
MLKHTPLIALHRELSAKLVDFSGWEMPLHYGSQLDEHHAVRRGAGWFDVSHMRVVDLHGAGGRDFLRGLLANNVDKLAVEGRALYSCMLNRDGGVIDDLIVYYLNPTWFRLVVNAGTAEKDLAWITARRDDDYPELEIRDRRDLAMVAVQGPNAREHVLRILPSARDACADMKPFHGQQHGEYFIARTGYTGEDGFEVMLPDTRAEAFARALTEDGVKPCGLGARDTLRLEAGMNLYGQDMDETVSPLESALAWTVDLKSDRDFIGRHALQSSDIARQIVGLALLERGVLRAHQVVSTRHGPGEITSGSFSPTLQRGIALARIPLGIAPGATVEVEIRDKKLPARVVKYPFVRNGQSLIEEQLK